MPFHRGLIKYVRPVIIIILLGVWISVILFFTSDIVDVSDGCGAKFQALIVSPQFEGKPLLQRHRLVNSALEAEMKEIHALQMKTLTPEQWEKQKS